MKVLFLSFVFLLTVSFSSSTSTSTTNTLAVAGCSNCFRHADEIAGTDTENFPAWEDAYQDCISNSSCNAQLKQANP